jgi:pimeloyl-ACP methyl ester carboxylesterase
MGKQTKPAPPQMCAYSIQELRLADGRTLAYASMGAPLATARLVCLYFHGVPASLVEAEPLAAAGLPLNIAVLAFDRPGESFVALVRIVVRLCTPLLPSVETCGNAGLFAGMGGSSFDPCMSISSVAADAAALMDHLQLSAAVQAGESGGAPYAAAFAALYPAWTQQLLLLAGLAATDGREHRSLRRSLHSMDRWIQAAQLLCPLYGR